MDLGSLSLEFSTQNRWIFGLLRLEILQEVLTNRCDLFYRSGWTADRALRTPDHGLQTSFRDFQTS